MLQELEYQRYQLGWKSSLEALKTVLWGWGGEEEKITLLELPSLRGTNPKKQHKPLLLVFLSALRRKEVR